MNHEDEINCEYALLRRQNMVCSSPLAYQLQLFFHPHTEPPSLPSLFCNSENFTVEILLRKIKYQWLNKLCYHFDVLLKKFVKGNSNSLIESRKLVECILRLFYCKTFFATRKRSILICISIVICQY